MTERIIPIEQLGKVDFPSLVETKERVRNVKVGLVIPPSTFLADERVFPFLGMVKVAAELEKNGNGVEVVDLSGVSNYEDAVANYARNTDVRVFGLTATTPQLPAATRVKDVLKTELPDSTVILGGPHVTLTHTAKLNDDKLGRVRRGTVAFDDLLRGFDKLVSGDGEMAIFDAIDPLNDKRIIDAASRHSQFFMQRGTLDNYEFPARHLIDMESYRYYIDGKRATSLIAQLGCPFECGFCGGRNTDFLRMTRTRGITTSVMTEVEQIIDMSEPWDEPIRAIMFYDDELNISPNALEELSRGLIAIQEKRGIDMSFRGFIKAELFTPEQAALMAQAGFKIVLSGVESGSDEILTTMRKRTSREVNSRAVEITHNAGMDFKALMSIGHPGETEESIAASVEWAMSNLQQGDDIDWTIITEYPGSPYYDQSEFIEPEGAWLYTEPTTGNRLWSSQVDFSEQAGYYKGVPGQYTAYVWTDTLTPDRLVELRDQAESETRRFLNLPEIAHAPEIQFEHSMGQGIGPGLLRKSNKGSVE